MTEQKAVSPRTFPSNAVQLVRTGQQMQLQLSQMADQKGSMLMGASLVVFTLAVGQLQAGRAMLLPFGMLALSAFLSALFAMFAVLPRITRIDGSQVGDKDNLLFFGVFSALDEDAFIDRTLATMESEETTYRAMLRDMYQAGFCFRPRNIAIWAMLTGYS
ncbi:MAG: Pycsar system effector family protein [Sphingobium sp.]